MSTAQRAQNFVAPVGYTYGASVTPSDTVDLTTPADAIYVGGAGNVVLNDAAGNSLTFNGLPAGSILPMRTSRVKATSTTATGIIALYY